MKMELAAQRLLREAALPDVDLIVDGDDGYHDARRSFNALVDRYPGAIAQPRTAAAVAAALRATAADDVPVAVRGGGHSVAGQGLCDDGLVIDLRRMRGVTVDLNARVAHVDGGALWLDLDAASARHGLATTGGTFPDTGVGGLTLGGGLGWLMGLHGLSCDNLVGAELVTPDGTILDVDEDREPDLLWALRGGGGNFGVVTRFDMRLHERGPVSFGRITYAPKDALAGLRAARDLTLAAPDELLQILFVRPSPDGPASQLSAFYAGPIEAAMHATRPLRDPVRPIEDGLAATTYLDVQNEDLLPFGMRHYWTGHFTRELSNEMIEALIEHVRGMPAIEGFVMAEPISGQARRIPADTAAFGQREARFNLSLLAMWTDPALDDEAVAWARTGSALLRPYSMTGGGYVNYMSGTEPFERVRATFGPERFARLLQLKRRYDPTNRFRYNHNIPVESD